MLSFSDFFSLAGPVYIFILFLFDFLHLQPFNELFLRFCSTCMESDYEATPKRIFLPEQLLFIIIYVTPSMR